MLSQQLRKVFIMALVSEIVDCDIPSPNVFCCGTARRGTQLKKVFILTLVAEHCRHPLVLERVDYETGCKMLIMVSVVAKVLILHKILFFLS